MTPEQVQCACCQGQGWLSIMPDRRRPRGWLTITQVARLVGLSREATWGHMRAGLLNVETGEWNGSRKICYLVPPIEVKRYADWINSRRAFGRQSSTKARYHELILSDRTPADVAKELGIKPRSVSTARARLKRTLADNGYLARAAAKAAERKRA